jgi:hypothetical protein
MHPRLRLIGLASYVLFMGGAVVALLLILAMMWSGKPASLLQWRVLGTSISVLAFALAIMVGTKALRDALAVSPGARADGDAPAR